jgi:hypothetical protein
MEQVLWVKDRALVEAEAVAAGRVPAREGIVCVPGAIYLFRIRREYPVIA